MSEERRLRVLRAIVEDYVRTSEPVGSKSLLERHTLGVSAATVRNDMASLEEDGLIAAPHTSAGRVPTDAGYRLFVDRLSAVKPLSAAERIAIARFLDGAADLDDVVDRSVRLLASLTHQVAVMQYPSLVRSAVRHIELVPMSATRLMLVLILDTGRVEQRIVEYDQVADLDRDGLVRELRDRLNAQAAGQSPAAVADQIGTLPDLFAAEHRDLVRTVGSALQDALREDREERVALAGTANLARFGPDFPTSIGPVLEALEEHVVLLKLLRSMSADVTADSVAVRIGAENPYAGLRTTSVVSSGYGTGGAAGLGVVGPTRMDYPMAMASVRAVARYVSEILDS